MSQNVRHWVVPATQQEWRPAPIVRIDREIDGLEKERTKHAVEVEAIAKKISELKDKRKSWTDGKSADGG